MNRLDAIDLARAHALAHGQSGDHAYLPTTDAEAAEWLPHAWVVDAIVSAAAPLTLAQLHAISSQAAELAALRADAERKPLTEAQIGAAMMSVDDPLQWGRLHGNGGAMVRQFVRAIERAHGIDAAMAEYKEPSNG